MKLDPLSISKLTDYIKCRLENDMGETITVAAHIDSSMIDSIQVSVTVLNNLYSNKLGFSCIIPIDYLGTYLSTVMLNEFKKYMI